MSSTSLPPNPRAVQLALSVAVGACVFGIAYAFARLVQAWVYPSPDPRAVTHVARIAFHWRMWVAGWAGVLGGIGGSALWSRAPERVDRMLPALAWLTALAVALQGVLVP